MLYYFISVFYIVKFCSTKFKLLKSLSLFMLVQELGNSDCAALRNNLIITMADFCVRYTALVDW